MIEFTCLVWRAVKICSPLWALTPALARKLNARARSRQLICNAQ
jgi:hypothetical protein